MQQKQKKIKIQDVSFSYAHRPILHRVNAELVENNITAIVGPSGQGKSTLLTILNRLWEGTPGASFQGRVEVCFDGRFKNIYDDNQQLPQLRRKIGMIFQTPNPLPLSIGSNVGFPLKLAGVKDKGQVASRVETALRQAFLWQEVKDRLNEDALLLSGGQQQRLCIARALIMEPEILLLDEPTASLDQTACAMIEDLLLHLQKSCTLVMVSHYLDQVKRVADIVWQLKDGCLTPSPDSLSLPA